jgi:hypothetical protein
MAVTTIKKSTHPRLHPFLKERDIEINHTAIGNLDIHHVFKKSLYGFGTSTGKTHIVRSDSGGETWDEVIHTDTDVLNRFAYDINRSITATRQQSSSLVKLWRSNDRGSNFDNIFNLDVGSDQIGNLYSIPIDNWTYLTGLKLDNFLNKIRFVLYRIDEFNNPTLELELIPDAGKDYVYSFTHDNLTNALYVVPAQIDPSDESHLGGESIYKITKQNNVQLIGSMPTTSTPRSIFGTGFGGQFSNNRLFIIKRFNKLFYYRDPVDPNNFEDYIQYESNDAANWTETTKILDGGPSQIFIAPRRQILFDEFVTEESAPPRTHRTEFPNINSPSFEDYDTFVTTTLDSGIDIFDKSSKVFGIRTNRRRSEIVVPE